MLTASALCALPNLVFAKSLQVEPLILGLVRNRSLYAMAVQLDTRGINWASAIDNDNLTNGIQVDTIFGSKPPLLLHAYNLNGRPLNRTIKTSWTRFDNPGEAGDQGFKIVASSALPTSYLVSNEVVAYDAPALYTELTWSDILELLPRFKRDAIASLTTDRFNDFRTLGRTLLKQTDAVYTGHRIELPSTQWTITTIQVKRKTETYPRILKLTWIERPSIKTIIYCVFDVEEMDSSELMGVWQLPMEPQPTVFVGGFNKGGSGYSMTSDLSKPCRTVNLGGSGC